MPHERNSYLKSKIDEERRLAYVALTRAKNYLKLSNNGSSLANFHQDFK